MFPYGLVFVLFFFWGWAPPPPLISQFFLFLCFIIRITVCHGCYEGDDLHLSRSSSSHRDLDTESGHSLLHADTPVGVLQEIALKCGTKVS